MKKPSSPAKNETTHWVLRPNPPGPADQILERLLNAGFEVDPADDGRVLVEPGSKLTEADRADLAAHEMELFHLLHCPHITDEMCRAIDRFCDLRGDDDTNHRDALTSEFAGHTRATRIWLTKHFNELADQWESSCGQPASIN